MELKPSFVDTSAGRLKHVSIDTFLRRLRVQKTQSSEYKFLTFESLPHETFRTPIERVTKLTADFSHKLASQVYESTTEVLLNTCRFEEAVELATVEAMMNFGLPTCFFRYNDSVLVVNPESFVLAFTFNDAGIMEAGIVNVEPLKTMRFKWVY